MQDLVILRNEVPVVSTFSIFEKMGYKEHSKLKRVISANIESFNEIGFLPLERQKEFSSTGGRPIESYFLDEDQFVLLVMLAKNSPESVELKVRLAREFRRMKKTLANLAAQRQNLDWQETRKDGKRIHNEKTDVIKKFVEYCEANGSKSANRYYCNLADMENKALFIFEHKYKNAREIMNIKQLANAKTADYIIEKALDDGMAENMYYKDIFKLAKERVNAFAAIIGKSQLHDLMLEG